MDHRPSTRPFLLLLFAALCSFGPTTAKAADQGTALSYQGRLTISGAPATGSFDLQFTLWDSASAGTLVAGPIFTNAVFVSGGQFAVALDFGSTAFTGSVR